MKDINEKCKSKNSLVIFVNPSTPDGKYYDFRRVDANLDRKNSCTILIDESFLDFLW